MIGRTIDADELAASTTERVDHRVDEPADLEDRQEIGERRGDHSGAG